MRSLKHGSSGSCILGLIEPIDSPGEVVLGAEAIGWSSQCFNQGLQTAFDSV